MLPFPRLIYPILLTAAVSLSGCNKEIAELPGPAAPVVPIGPVALRTGTMLPQGGVPSSGTLALERDAAGTEYVRFDASFRTDFHTGSLGVYLAKSDALVRVQRAANASNVLRVGTITRDGAQTLTITGSSAGFTHVIIHCDPAQYNFGAALLQ